MGTAAKFGLVVVVGVLGLFIGTWLGAPAPKAALAPTCPTILPANGGSNGYALFLTDGNGDFMYGVVHFYPNGFRHNAAVLFDTANNPSSDPVTLFDVAVPGGCSPADGGAPATLTLTRDGTPAANLQFSPSGDPNATYAVTFTAVNGSGSSQASPGAGVVSPLGSVPAQTQMTGSAYLIANQ
ncbi:MAG TPA: hypothetical protein VKR31_02995 [Rhizomicrobium sp.]|nr:hypothetical protein [Rhizomicrobium sp.]